MKVLFDAYWWFDGPPSGKNVLRSIVRTWATKYPTDKISLLLPQAQRKNVSLAHLGREYPNMEFVFTRAPQHAFAAISAGMFSPQFDAVIAQNFAPMFSRGKRCVFIHDLMFEEHPEWFTRAERFYLRFISLTSSRADRIFTSSVSESARIARRLPQVKAPIIPIGLALGSEYAASKSKALSAPSVPQDFLLSVGRINVRKNLEVLVRSLTKAELIDSRRPLVIVGAPDGAQGRSLNLDRATSDGAVLWTGSISNGELKWAYENCSAFIFPSLDEGFGLPVLEAIDAGARIALSDIPAFREFGDVGLFFNPHDDADIGDKVGRVLEIPPKGPLRIPSEATWPMTVAKLRDAVMN